MTPPSDTFLPDGYRRWEQGILDEHQEDVRKAVMDRYRASLVGAGLFRSVYLHWRIDADIQRELRHLLKDKSPSPESLY